MKNSKNLKKCAEGGLTMGMAYPSDSASGNMVEGFDKRRKQSKTAKKNNQSRPCLTCHKRNS